MNYYNKFFDKKISLQYSIQRVIMKLQTAFPNKKRTCFNKICFFKKVQPCLYTARIWQNFLTLKAFRSSSQQMFYEIGVFENFAENFQKTLVLESFFNKVVGLDRLQHKRFSMCVFLLDVSHKITFVIEPLLGQLAYSGTHI